MNNNVIPFVRERTEADLGNGEFGKPGPIHARRRNIYLKPIDSGIEVSTHIMGTKLQGFMSLIPGEHSGQITYELVRNTFAGDHFKMTFVIHNEDEHLHDKLKFIQYMCDTNNIRRGEVRDGQ